MGRIKDEYGISTTLLRAQIEERIPAAFSTYKRPEHGSIPTGIASIDVLVQGVPLHALTEICGAGKTSVLVSLLARASQEHHCALVDASDAFDPVGAEAAGTDLSRLLWVRCGKTKQKLRPLEQAFKVTDMLLQSSGFGLIVVDLSDIAEKAGIALSAPTLGRSMAKSRLRRPARSVPNGGTGIGQLPVMGSVLI
jgi:hypothetical protein